MGPDCRASLQEMQSRWAVPSLILQAAFLWLVCAWCQKSCPASCFPKHLRVTDSIPFPFPPAHFLAVPSGVSSFVHRDFKLKSKHLLKSNKIRKANMKKISNESHNDFQIYKDGDHLQWWIIHMAALLPHCHFSAWVISCQRWPQCLDFLCLRCGVYGWPCVCRGRV